jgi:peptidyl-prolyl cis-trans isomerase B (cyclophilin B)
MTTALFAMGAQAGPATAQLTPERTYYGRYRPVPMNVRIPPGQKGEPVIALLDAVTAIRRASSPVGPGTVNLEVLFPSLWQEKKPEEKTPEIPRLVYAQLIVGDKKIGPAVVLQPMLDAPYAPYIDENGTPQFRQTKGVYSGLRAYVERHIILETSLGDIELAMRPDEAPNTTWNFLALAAGGFYTDIIFHRVKAVNPTNGAPFVIQAGDPLQRADSPPPEPGKPTGAGEGGPGYWLNLEPSKLPHDFGILSMARKSDGTLPNLAGSQFFISLSRKGTESLDGKYTAFAQAVSGGDVILKIAATELLPGTDRPKDPPIIKRCRLVDAPPYGEGPPPVKRPDDKPVQR